MSFTIYPCLEQYWLDKKTDEFDIDWYDIIENTLESGFDAKTIFKSANPFIYSVITLIIQELLDEPLLENLSERLKNELSEALHETIFINSIDSHLDALYVFRQFQSEIQEELQMCEDLETSHEEQMELIYQLFERYDF